MEAIVYLHGPLHMARPVFDLSTSLQIRPTTETD